MLRRYSERVSDLDEAGGHARARWNPKVEVTMGG
jgi:hypothetical protein